MKWVCAFYMKFFFFFFSKWCSMMCRYCFFFSLQSSCCAPCFLSLVLVISTSYLTLAMQIYFSGKSSHCLFFVFSSPWCSKDCHENYDLVGFVFIDCYIFIPYLLILCCLAFVFFIGNVPVSGVQFRKCLTALLIIICLSFWFLDVLEGEIFLQNLPSIVTAHALGNYYSIIYILKVIYMYCFLLWCLVVVKFCCI